MKRIIFVVCVFGVILCGSSNAAILGRIYTTGFIGIKAVGIESADFGILDLSKKNNSSVDSSSLWWLNLTPSDIGKTFVADHDTPNFNFLTFMLTNGTDGYLSFPVRIPHGVSWGWNLESEVFSEDHPYYTHGEKYIINNYPDFFGYSIESISMTLNDLTIVSPGANPNGDGIWTEVDYDLTYTIIPEPATLLLLGLGAVILKKRKK